MTPSWQLKAGIVACSFGAVLVWESLLPIQAGRRGRLAHIARNLLLGAVNTVIGAAALVVLIGPMCEASARGRLGVLHHLPTPPWIAWVVGLVLMDGWMYVWHRLNHRVGFLWRFHAVHHSDAEMDASSAVRFHTGEIVLSSVARLAVAPLLGLVQGQIVLYETALLPVILLHHGNVRLPGRVDRLLRCLIVTPGMHWVHHSQRRVETDSNYGSVLSIWDRLGRSFRLHWPLDEIRLGLSYFTERSRRTLGGMLAAPFRTRRGGDA